MANRAKTRAELVDEAIEEIRRFYRKGRAAPRRQPFKKTYGQKAIGSKATGMNTNEDTLRKARQFTEEYSPDDLNRLCQLIRSKQGGRDEDGPVFSASHVIRLLTLPKKRERVALQREAIEGAWSRQQLNVEIAKRYGPRRDAGRKPYVPADLGGAYAKIESLCEGFRRWLEELRREDAAGEHVVLKDLPSRLSRKVVEAGEVLGQVQQLVTQELRKEWPARELRRPQRGASVGATASNRKGRR